MTIRTVIVTAAVPLFLLLALVNGALLHFQERTEMEQALNDQALAATVTIAEFVREMDDPRAAIAQPVREKALRATLPHITGLDGLYLVEPGRQPLALKPSGGTWNPGAIPPPRAPRSRGPVAGPDGQGYWVTAVAPAGGQRFVAARFDARPISARMDEIRRDVLLITLLAGVYAAGLAIFVARRITRELQRNREALSGEDRPTAGNEFRIREARDLADAVRLMEASRQAAETRSQRSQSQRAAEMNAARAITDVQSAILAPSRIHSDGIEIALRICGDAPAGSFFAHCFTEAGGAVVLGRCGAAKAIDALAAAVEVRRLVERQDSTDGLLQTLDTARSIYAIEAIELRIWTRNEVSDGLELLTLADEQTAKRAATYCRANTGIAPDRLLGGLEIMLAPTGLFAALAPIVSVNAGERGVEIGLKRENAAEPADVKHFAH